MKLSVYIFLKLAIWSFRPRQGNLEMAARYTLLYLWEMVTGEQVLYLVSGVSMCGLLNISTDIHITNIITLADFI